MIVVEDLANVKIDQVALYQNKQKIFIFEIFTSIILLTEQMGKHKTNRKGKVYHL